MKQRITICIDEKLLEDIDNTRGLVSRSTFIDKFLGKHFNFQTAKELLKN